MKAAPAARYKLMSIWHKEYRMTITGLVHGVSCNQGAVASVALSRTNIGFSGFDMIRGPHGHSLPGNLTGASSMADAENELAIVETCIDVLDKMTTALSLEANNLLRRVSNITSSIKKGCPRQRRRSSCRCPGGYKSMRSQNLLTSEG